MDCHEWAEAEFGDVELGDERRSLRAVKLAEMLANSPGSSIPKAAANWADTKAAYRFLSSEFVNHEALVEPHLARTQQKCRQSGCFLLIEDTTAVSFTHRPDLEGASRIGADQGHGCLLHTTMAVQYFAQGDRTEVIGLFDQAAWVRPKESFKSKEKRWDQLKRSRESEYWARFGENVEGPGEDTNWVYIADRESDIYEVFVRLDEGVDYVIRSCYNRTIEGVKGQAIFQEVRESEVLGEVEIPVRARPGRGARTAVAKVRSCIAVLHPPKRPGMKLPVLEPIKIVEVFEEKKPEKGPPLHWILLTSLPADTFEQALYIAKLYEKRWLVEEYHKALKSGTKIEHSQLGSMDKIDALLGILAVLAVRLLGLKNGRDDDDLFTPEDDEQIIVEILEHKGLRPKEGWTRTGYVRAIARVGGFLARKGDGEPGWQSIWTGMFRLLSMVEGIKMARGFNNSG